jgi:hypothetical protein
MKLTIDWYGNYKYADYAYANVVFQDGGATIEASMLNKAERESLANHLREVADELSPTSEGD